MKFDIPYSSIAEVKEISCFATFWFASYTSLSMDQLEISFSSRSVGRSGLVKVENQSVIISPKKKEEFISMLESRLPGIQVIRRERKK
ncbi:MAG: PH domain-containing protein [Methanomassiliicoccaceae archaeon]|nr:PH domain-containing protein [Methanomassiliicoccaceae archaeon]